LKSYFLSGQSITKNNVQNSTVKKEDKTVSDFCEQEKLYAGNQSDTIGVNEIFTIEFGKPNFQIYLSNFGKMYSER